jgi:hypothetical protein
MWVLSCFATEQVVTSVLEDTNIMLALTASTEQELLRCQVPSTSYSVSIRLQPDAMSVYQIRQPIELRTQPLKS